MGGAVDRKWCWMSKEQAGIGAGRKKECEAVVNENRNTIKDGNWSSRQGKIGKETECVVMNVERRRNLTE